MLTIVFGCHKFHDYIYGLPHISVKTDHKPLESILSNPIHAAPARLQRMVMSVQRYAIQVSYIPGKELLVADALSRSPLPDLADDLEYQEYNINILHTLPVTEAKLEELKQSTKADPALTDLTHTVQNGWPEKRSNVPIGAQPFWNYHDEVTYHHGILFKGNRVIVPASMRTAMLKLVHASHLGVDRCKRQARDIVFWPGMNAEIEDLINNCTTCSTYKRTNPREPLLSHSVPERPCEKVGVDLCEFEGQHYLIMVDYYSNFIEADRLRQTTSEHMIEICKSQFARHGIPNMFVSDNGPQFSSHQFDQFSIQYQFDHQPSSPHYPQSNGKVEKAVQTVKNLLRKSQAGECDFQLALLEFRNTPTNSLLGSPAQRLMGRRTRTLLPTANKLLLPKTIPPSQVQSELTKQRADQKYHYDKHSQPLMPLKKGDTVSFQKGRLWLPATILANTKFPRSYLITTPDGQTYSRNCRHLRPTRTHSECQTKPGLGDGGSSDEEEERHEQEQEQTQEESTNREHEPTPPVTLRRSQRKTAHPCRYASTYTRVSDITSMEGEM